MHPTKTYELRLKPLGQDNQNPSQTKELLKSWLLTNDVESFVEGALDVDINHDYQTTENEYYANNGGLEVHLSIYMYNLEELEMLKVRIESEFAAAVECSIESMDTQVWMDGWKESFKPFTTEKFYVRPPWEAQTDDSSKIDLVIEPGMAFGTGQHATTKVCLAAIERLLAKPRKPLDQINFLDVGTGTGILAIAAAKLGVAKLLGTDIEVDAINASKENAKENSVKVDFERGSVPKREKYDFVIGNILTVVLQHLLVDIAEVMNDGGIVILSGLLNEEEDFMRSIGEQNGLKLMSVKRQSGWSCLVMEK